VVSRRRDRTITAEELRLWLEAVRHVVPLREGAPKIGDQVGPIKGSTEASPKPHKRQPSVSNVPTGKKAGLGGGAQGAPGLVALERRFLRRLRRGTSTPGAVIDLHGLTQDEASRRLAAFLRRCQSQGVKAAVVITGKGTASLKGEGHGVLRRAVPLWLAGPELRQLVVGFEEAGAGLGGSGALILRIRAARRA
jgi:DNA-nicking Smr family endonuclease